MSQKPMAVVDASVVILVGLPPPKVEPKELPLRRERATECLRALGGDGIDFVVPAPTITELGRDGDGEELAKRFFARLGGMQVKPFDLPAALVAAKMLKHAFASKAAHESRAAIKYDAMIAAIAHALNAKCLVTANARDFGKYLAEVASPVELIAADEVPKKGQLRLIDRKA